MYVKIRIEGWLETNENALNNISLEKVAYEMTEGNGICTSMIELRRTDDLNEVDGGAENFFVGAER